MEHPLLLWLPTALPGPCAVGPDAEQVSRLQLCPLRDTLAGVLACSERTRRTLEQDASALGKERGTV